MKRAWSDRRGRIITVSAVVLAVSATIIILGPRTDLVRACGCAIDPSCSPMSSSGTSPSGGGSPPEESPPPGGWTASQSRSGEINDPDQHRAISIPLDHGGVAVKFSFYRGLGGGVTSSITRDGLALTFEGGAGVGGSFSVGSVNRRPDSGPSFEARASTSGRLRIVRPPDFGLTLSRDGTLQAYMDAKTGQFRTRFRSKLISLTGNDVQQRPEAPATRRSWSLGTEYKVAAAYTVRVPLDGLFDVWTWLFGGVPDDWNSRAPPAHSTTHVGYAAVLGRAALRRSAAARPRRTERRESAADRFCGPRARVLRVLKGGRRTRSARPRTGAPPRAPRTGRRDDSAPATEDDDEAATEAGQYGAADLDCGIDN